MRTPDAKRPPVANPAGAQQIASRVGTSEAQGIRMSANADTCVMACSPGSCSTTHCPVGVYDAVVEVLEGRLLQSRVGR